MSDEHDANDHVEGPRHDNQIVRVSSQHEPQFAQQWHRCWGYVTDVAATLWVLRAPVAALLTGYVILWFMPQAQDLLVDLTGAGWQGLVVFLALVTFVWAMPTEYAATILLETDERYCARIKAACKPGKPAEPAPAPASELAAVTDGPRGQFRAWLQTWMPPLLGGLVFLCMLGAAFRSHQNVPTIGLDHYTEQVKEKLTMIELLLVLCFLDSGAMSSRGQRLPNDRQSSGPSAWPAGSCCRFVNTSRQSSRSSMVLRAATNFRSRVISGPSC